jgi:transposase
MKKKSKKRNTSTGKSRYADKWRIPDALWERMEPLLPPRKPHPLGCHNPRVPDRNAMDAIFFVLRTGCQWNALNATGICSSSSAHRRFQEWTEAGVFELIWALGLDEYEELKGIDWSWQSMDGAMTKAPLGGEKNRAQPNRSSQAWNQAKSAYRRRGDPARSCGGRRQHQRLQAGARNHREHSAGSSACHAASTAGAVFG